MPVSINRPNTTLIKIRKDKDIKIRKDKDKEKLAGFRVECRALKSSILVALKLEERAQP